jgi:hypothetical protein
MPGRSLELALWFAKLLGPVAAIHSGDCTRERANRRWPRFLAIRPSIQNAVAPGEPSCCPPRLPRMRQDPYDWPRVGGVVVVWLVIAVVAGTGLLALFDPGSIQVLVTAEL